MLKWSDKKKVTKISYYHGEETRKKANEMWTE